MHLSESENGKTFTERRTDGAFPVGTGAWRHSEKYISHHYNLSISLETAAHLLNKCWFSIILCLSWFIPFYIFPPEGLFASPSSWISVGGKKRGTYILLAFILFPISLLPQGKSWLFLCTCRILHTSGVWHCNIFSAICILNDLKFDWE